MARKVGIDLPPDELPMPPESDHVGGNEMEGILVRALRLYETQPSPAAEAPAPPGGPTPAPAQRPLPEILREVIADVRPSAHVERLALMDLLAVKECTDSRFLPPRFRDLTLSEVNRRIAELRSRIGE
jgi:hypothetical protein